MNRQEEFYNILGELLFFCQCIEHDVKYIYARMLKGNVDETLVDVENNTLGRVVNMLEDLDNSDGDPMLAEDDYNLLKQITKERNYWVHLGYIDYIYMDNMKAKNNKFEKQYARLLNFYNRLSKLYKNIEKVRIDYYKAFDM